MEYFADTTVGVNNDVGVLHGDSSAIMDFIAEL